MLSYAKIFGLFILAFAVNAMAPALLVYMQHLAGAESAIASTLWCLSLFFRLSMSVKS